MSTYCYGHGLVETGCSTCLARVADMLAGVPPYRAGISDVDAYASFFPQVR